MLANVLVGFALFGSVFILPQYLGQVQRYNAEQIGTVLAWTGLPQLLLIPLVPLILKRFDARHIGFVGISIFAASCFMNTTLSPDTAGDQFWFPNIVRAIGQALVLTPVSTITTAGIAPSEAGAASGLSNMLRNLGGAVGTATLAHRADEARAIPLQYHRPVGDALSRRGAPEDQRPDTLLHDARRDRSRPAQHQAIAAIGATVRRQALIMGFSDTFAVIGTLLGIAAVALLFARPVKTMSGAGGAH